MAAPATPSPAPSPTLSPSPQPRPSTTMPPGATAAVPVPSLSPGETITWARVDRPRLDLLGIFVSSFWIVLVAAVVSISIGVALGAVRARRAARAGGRLTRLDFRAPDQP